jgi:hypothetical protein
MGVFRKRAPRHLISVSPDNAASNDWVILLEAGTIVAPSPDRLRVAKSMDLLRHASGHTTDWGPHKGEEIVWQLRDYQQWCGAAICFGARE